MCEFYNDRTLSRMIAESVLTSCVWPVFSRLYPARIAAANGNDGDVENIKDRAKFTMASLIVLLPSITAGQKGVS